ncbi:MAG: membrane protein insertase YidC [Verrucomicrobiota bacterium]|nr:membrane protein insertase YidC [Verrucomicrobiota bacterium]
MDRTSVIVVTICVILLFTWPALMEKISPTPPQPIQPTNAAPAQVAGQTNAPNTAPFQQAPPSQGTFSPDFEAPVKLDSPKISILESEESFYIFTSEGGLKTVELKKPHVVIGDNVDLLSDTNNEDAALKPIILNHGVESPVFALKGVDNSEFSMIADGNLVTMVSTNKAGIRITKKFRAGTKTNYLLHSTITLTNPMKEPVALPQWKLMLGTSMPLKSGSRYPVWGAQWHNGEDMEDIDESWFANRTLGCFPGTPRTDFISAGQPINWVGVHNRFFAMTTMPNTNNLEALPGARVYSTTTTHRLQNEPQDEDEQYVHDSGIQAGLQFDAHVLKPGESVELQFTTYAGPKEYRLLEAHALTYGNSIDSVMGFDGFFGYFAKILLWAMSGIHNSFGLGYALCIIVITIIIKLLFWPLTRASTVSMKRMAAYQPHMAEIREKYKDDSQKMNKRIMEFMREHKINPLGGCLPILIQIPVFFGFFTMLRSAVELRGAQFLWACDLSQSDTVAHIFGFPINPLPMIMGVTMILQARMTPVSPTADATQQKIMKYMPLMFIVILYNFSAGLTLYWTVQNMLSILQTKLTKNIVVEAPLKSADSPLAKPIKNKRKRKK